MTTLSIPRTAPEKSPAPAHQFPRGFLWGAATAAYQIEGAVNHGGRGECIWTRFAQRPGAIAHGQSGAFACDHYNRLETDLDLMSELGIQVYRFSIAWPRIQPSGTGEANPEGIDFYQRLVDGLLERDILPLPTLYHWDLPQALENHGGWRNRDTAYRFADYTGRVTDVLGDRVQHWTTFNEPYCIVELGHRHGVQAPGACEPEKVVRQVYHHVLLAHGLAAAAIRDRRADAKIGFVHLTGVPDPLFEDEECISAARRSFHDQNAWVLHPLFHGEYPEDIWEKLGNDTPDVQNGDLKLIGAGLDYLGVNSYSSWNLMHPTKGLLEPEEWYPRTDMGWPITPDVLYWAVRFIHEAYAPEEMYITESGCAYPDEVGPDGEVMDYARIAYLRQHLRSIHRATQEDIPIKGYIAWSLLDNFEWAFGYDKRFGLIHVNFETFERTPKMSANWYSRVIAHNAL